MWAPIHECLDRLEALRDPHAATYRNATDSSSLRSYYGALERLDRLYRSGPGDGVGNNVDANDERKLREFFDVLASKQEENAIAAVQVARSIIARQKTLHGNPTVEQFNEVTPEEVRKYFQQKFPLTIPNSTAPVASSMNRAGLMMAVEEILGSENNFAKTKFTKEDIGAVTDLLRLSHRG